MAYSSPEPFLIEAISSPDERPPVEEASRSGLLVQSAGEACRRTAWRVT
ncbi:hypothetical protein [Actinomadura sp. 6N118]